MVEIILESSYLGEKIRGLGKNVSIFSFKNPMQVSFSCFFFSLSSLEDEHRKKYPQHLGHLLFTLELHTLK